MRRERSLAKTTQRSKDVIPIFASAGVDVLAIRNISLTNDMVVQRFNICDGCSQYVQQILRVAPTFRELEKLTANQSVFKRDMQTSHLVETCTIESAKHEDEHRPACLHQRERLIGGEVWYQSSFNLIIAEPQQRAKEAR